MKLAVNTVIFGLNEAVARGLVLAERPGSTASWPTASSPTAPVGGPVRPVQAGGVHRPRPDADRVRAGPSPAKDLGLIRVLADRVGWTCPNRGQPRHRQRRVADLGGGSDFSAVATHLRTNGRQSRTPQEGLTIER
jgi:3-hydroxyisobutyrate dehydrogenase/2-hydroxy-3-oxopropionate reductase